ncbi:MAG: SixA phosphatase family protein [Gaiella sp.]
MPRLWVLRHAKSSWEGADLADHERPLSARGRKACTALRRHCATAAVLPEVVLCSTATRTRETLDRLLPALGDPVIHLEDGLYLASAHTLLTRLRSLDVESALVVGHNPGLHELVLALAAPSPHRERIVAKLPTGALATLDHDGWPTLAPGRAVLSDLVLPREL